MLSCLLLQFGLFASAIAGLLALFVCNKMLYVHFSQQLQQQLHLWFCIKEGKEERREEGDRLLLSNWVEAFEL